jgi:Spy/CpxP family protein refolding chaperone
MLTATDVVSQVVNRVRGEFTEMPGLKLTPAQAQRLWGLEQGACRQVLQMLTDSRFLRRTRDGAYVLCPEQV